MDRVVSRGMDAVKAETLRNLSDRISDLAAQAEAGKSPRELEISLWPALLEAGQKILGGLYASVCVRETEVDLAQRGLGAGEFWMRLERAYWATITTTVGKVCFPLSAYRDLDSGRTMVPARDGGAFAFYPRTRSSAVCLEWETRLGGDLPFRKAERELEFFSHGAVTMEDTTIERHMVAVASAIDRSWLYRAPEDVREILQQRATRDGDTGKPIVFISSDAHLLRRFEDESWDASWKAANGLRLWCEDRQTGRIIHLGGEYTNGDCHEVGRLFAQLVQDGVIPRDGDYGQGVHAQYVFVSDGMPWFDDYLLPHLDPDAVVRILDAYHLLERMREYARGCCAAATKKGDRLVRALVVLVLGKGERRKRATCRRGRTKQRAKKRRRWYRNPPNGQAYAVYLRDRIEELHITYSPRSGAADDLVDALLSYVDKNIDRIDYREFRRRGFQIGSGAMESLHRSASQVRTKVAGARWLPNTLQAIFNVRMLRMVGAWDRFWRQDNLALILAEAFEPNLD